MPRAFRSPVIAIGQKYGLGAAIQHPARRIELEWPETIDAAIRTHVEWPDYQVEWPLLTSKGEETVQDDRCAARMEI